MEFGQKLKTARAQAGLTQEDVVRHLGVSRQTVSNWENNRSYPDLASILKLSDLYGLSLDDMLKEDAGLQRRLEERKERMKKSCAYLHDFAMLLIAVTIPLVWLEKLRLGVIFGLTGFLLICAVYVLFVLKLGADWKHSVLRCVAYAMWLTGFMIRIFSGHQNRTGDLLWMTGLSLQCYGSYQLKWDALFPKHMTAFSGFVLAMALVFGTIPLVGDFLVQGHHIEENPFIGRDYRVSQVVQGDEENVPMVYLGQTNRAYLDYVGEKQRQLGGKFTVITQPEGGARKGIWEMIPEESPDILYRVTVEADNGVTMACLDHGVVLWEYLLEPSPKAGCTIWDVLGVMNGSVGWYYKDSFDEEDVSTGIPLRGKGTINLSVPGDAQVVTIYEEFRDGDSVTHQTMTLEKDDRGIVSFRRETGESGQKQTGIYRIPYEDGEFVLVLNYIP